MDLLKAPFGPRCSTTLCKIHLITEKQDSECLEGFGYFCPKVHYSLSALGQLPLFHWLNYPHLILSVNLFEKILFNYIRRNVNFTVDVVAVVDLGCAWVVILLIYDILGSNFINKLEEEVSRKTLCFYDYLNDNVKWSQDLT